MSANKSNERKGQWVLIVNRSATGEEVARMTFDTEEAAKAEAERYLPPEYRTNVFRATAG